MYKYEFNCRTDFKEGKHVTFTVAGELESREDCVKVHNALLASPSVVLTCVSILKDG